VYFDLEPGRIKLSALNAAYPGMVDALVQHEGIGVVVGYDDDDAPVAFGKRGARQLRTGVVAGEDPLALYGDAELRAEQLCRIAEFPHNGDLTIVSTVYPDGTVAAMEELVGNHGGIGGEQTDAFIFHPPTLQVPATRNSADFFQFLNSRRGLDLPRRAPAPPPHRREVWSPRFLAQSMARVGRWMPLALRALVLEPQAYRQAARDSRMTGAALLIGVVTSVAFGFTLTLPTSVVDAVSRAAQWLAFIFVVYGTGRLLGGKADFTMTLRAIGFSRMTSLFGLLALIPPISRLAQLAAVALLFLATWIATAEAHGLRAWRSLLIPVLGALLMASSIILLGVLIRGTEFTLLAFLAEFGLAP
jgi:hypothetical protein